MALKSNPIAHRECPSATLGNWQHEEPAVSGRVGEQAREAPRGAGRPSTAHRPAGFSEHHRRSAGEHR